MSETEITIMKKCCGLCPFSRLNTLYLSPERGEYFAYMATNPYTDFICHKTGVIHEDHPDEERQTDIVRGEKSLTCAGFHVLQKCYDGKEPEIEFNIDDHFTDPTEMADHHLEYYESQN